MKGLRCEGDTSRGSEQGAARDTGNSRAGISAAERGECVESFSGLRSA